MSRTFSRITVYCGSRVGDDPRYADGARAMGRALAERGIGLVYGGGHVGLMGAIADAVLAEGGEVIGVIPEKLRDLELAHEGVTRLEVVPDMHARKHRMAALGDAFVAMPGGYGTLEELFEVITWTQLEYHHKPVGVLDIAGYYAGLREVVANAIRHGFVRELHRDLVLFDEVPSRLLDQLAAVRLPRLDTWLHAP